MSHSSRVLKFVGRTSAALAVAVTVAANSHAGVVLNVSAAGVLTGATGVEVGGVSYDVSFVDGSCSSLFSGCDIPTDDFAFTTDTEALAAAQMLLDAVFIDGPAGQFDSSPGLTNGCGDAQRCLTLTPYAVQIGVGISTVFVASAFNASPDFAAPDAAQLTRDARDASSAANSATTWALWTRAATVPEPSSLALLGVAGIALGWSQRRRRVRTTDRAR